MANEKTTAQYTPPPTKCTLGGGIDYSRIPGPVDQPICTPEAFAKGKSTVTMIFEKYVCLDGAVHFTPGVHEVPVEIADHWYLNANGARRYIKPETTPAA